MQRQTRVEFTPKNAKCVSLKPRSYTIVTEDVLTAEIVARGLLEQDTRHYNLYKPVFAFDVAYVV